MRKLLLIALLSPRWSAHLHSPLMAAPVYKAPPPVAPVWSSTGFYVGLNGGYG